MELAAIIIAGFALVVSIIALVVAFRQTGIMRKQTDIMEEELKEIKKKMFYDEPHNAYTVKLDGISRGLSNIASEIKAANASDDQYGR